MQLQLHKLVQVAITKVALQHLQLPIGLECASFSFSFNYTTARLENTIYNSYIFIFVSSFNLNILVK
jgi:hypothetical protein